MKLEANEIRLLRLDYSPAEKKPHLSLCFEHVSLTHSALPPFVALSYVWGDLEDVLPLPISGRTVRATRNLHRVLDCLSASRFDQLLWIDALCINQDDPQERASQVALMGDIYSQAEYVLAFLSPDGQRFDLGLDYIEEAARNPDVHFEPSLSPHLKLKGFNATDKILQDSLIGFFAAPWWTRIWTVQEFLLARRVVFQCGDRLLDARVVQKSCRAWIHHANSCCWAARRPIDGNVHGFLDNPSKDNNDLTIYTATLRMKHLIDIADSARSYTTDFLAAISLFRIRRCSDPRDRAFGFLGLRLPGIDIKNKLTIDYTIPTSLLYRDLAMALIEESQTLDVLSHVLHDSGVEKRTSDLPSWVPDWDAAIDDRYHLIYTERTDVIRHCRASGDIRPQWKLDAAGSVFTCGFQIATIEATAPGYPSNNPHSMLGGKTIIDAWRQLAGLPADRTMKPFGEVTGDNRERLLQNALSGGLASTPWKIGSSDYSKACETWLEWFVSANGDLPEASKKTIQDFDEMIQQVSLYRKLIRTDNGSVGFGPEMSEKGDVIVILPGGKVLYVLRRLEIFGSGAPRFQLVGDAFIQGAMAGEMIDLGTSLFEEMVIL
ncbi:Ff.00g054410.m01.CDS01 [Fusarium sp. VM40]|nr:Ff.00g054410.m01.CDS01 [Fusarium sp. VM40]